MQDKDISVLNEERVPDDAATPGADQPEAKTLTSQVTDLIDDVRLLAQAEVEYYRVKLSVNMAATKRIMTLFGLGVICASMAVISLILGMLLILSRYLGPVAATAIVTGAALLVAAVTINMAINRAKKLPLDETDA